MAADRFSDPVARWKQRTDGGKQLAGGWTHKSVTPPREAQYEVRGARYCYLTWAYGQWWHQSVGDDAMGISGTWHRIKGSYDWRGPRWEACSVNWGHVIQQAADGGNEDAKREIEEAVRKWDARVADQRKAAS